MTKRYVHTVADDSISTIALLEARADENPRQYPVGSQYSLVNGLLLVVVANDGTNVTIQEANNSDAEIFAVMTYDFQKESAILNIPETYTPVAQLITPLRAAGTYVLGFSLTWHFDRTTESVFLRWRQDGGTWNEYSSEPTEKTDANTAFYEFPDNYIEQVHDIEVEMRKESAQGIFNLDFIDIFFQRVGL